MSGFSPVALSFLGLVFVAAMCLSIPAVRRDHPDHVHTLWYVLSLTLCAVSVLFFCIYEIPVRSRARRSAEDRNDRSYVHEGFDGCSGGDIHPSDGRRVASYCRKYSAISLAEYSVADSPSRQKPLSWKKAPRRQRRRMIPILRKRSMPECSKPGQTAELRAPRRTYSRRFSRSPRPRVWL